MNRYLTLIFHTILTPFLPSHEVNGAPMFQRHKSGFSLVELMIVFAIIGILGAICVGAGGGCVTTSERQGSAERNARQFASAMGWSIKGVVCSGADTPNKDGMGDGYVSCTLSLAGDVPATKAILCGYDRMVAPLGQNTACREANPISIQPQ